MTLSGIVQMARQRDVASGTSREILSKVERMGRAHYPECHTGPRPISSHPNSEHQLWLRGPGCRGESGWEG